MADPEVVPYCGQAPLPSTIWSSWNLDPALLAVLVAAALAVLALRPGQARAAWGLGIAALALAFVSPLCALGSALFSARSFNHLVILGIAAPFLAQALPAPRGSRIALPLAASTIVLWAWHWPAAYAAAYESTAVYWALQIALLASFVWFWRVVLAPATSPVAALLAIGAGAGQMGLLGALLTFAPRALYEVHGLASLPWGLDPLSDQQLGGLLMWVPAFFLYGAFALRTGRRLAEAAA
ncbi:cytochrome c oxidase assembly protein [Enterovirga rhinocerotis]|uniref:Putative membrane protein n=1 Tax=Enterovirga rhinocerotis TaxID=1339210 RepID=A0A4R7BZS1_9HYPH|nr:cytochrome c oxidase assembly protein [Enterovirga rhinocerotis]TDR89606.1 putative membrane protein [Enterovirga rhinocerotis]